MRNLILLFAYLFCFSSKAEQIPQFAEGQQLFVVAQSGLNLRSEPSNEAAVILKINYGKMVLVADNDDPCLEQMEIDFIKGQWVEVDFEGILGYVFDGYLSPIAVPSYDFDTETNTDGIMDAFESWAPGHLVASSNVDTIVNEKASTVIHHFEGDEKLTQTRSAYGYSCELILAGVRIMDGYHFVKGLVLSNDDKRNIEENSLFIKGKNGDISQIKINLNDKIEIKKLKENKISIKISKKFDQGC